MRKNVTYRTDISTAKWWAYDIPGNIGWITYFAGLAQLIRRGRYSDAARTAVPAALMATGICELISERTKGLDRELPEKRLLRGFGALTLGGITGAIAGAAGLRTSSEKKTSALMSAGGGLCAVFAGLLFKGYKKTGVSGVSDDMKENGGRKAEIKNAYRTLGKTHNFYDNMMTGSTAAGMAVVKTVWQMNREDMLEYQSKVFEPIPSDFKGKILEVPVGTGVLSMPVWKTLPKADITCVDYSEKMMEAAEARAISMGVNNASFRQGDVGALPYEDETFDAIVSMNGFHAFPDKEAAYRETFRVLKQGGLFTGCFYVEKSNKHTDRIIRTLYTGAGYFTPPFETVESLRKRLESMYSAVEVSNIESIAVFRCVK